ncbi:MAG: carboxymuconolactone decarboxylase family protein [Spirochaetaceae bacterium]|nr:MAG: carboxymuconolactone decarboxylase family protein [Spirochaetaceae bacterium]
MPRIAPKPLSRYPWYLRLMYARQRRVYGGHLVPTLVWGRVPVLLRRFLIFFAGFERRRSALDPVLRALITVRVSQINWCAFCVDFNAARVLSHGDHEEKLSQLASFRDSGIFSEAEKLALEYAEVITRSDVQVDDELFARLRRHYGEDAIVELTGLIAFQNMSSKFNAALDIEPQGLCRIQTRLLPSQGEP